MKPDQRRSILAPSLVVVALLLPVGPFILLRELKTFGPAIAMGVWSACTILSLFALAFAMSVRMREQGWEWRRDRPEVGLAGREWGVFAPQLVLPPVAVFALGWSAFAIVSGRYVIEGLFIALMTGSLVFATISAAKDRKRKLAELLLRPDNPEFAALIDMGDGTPDGARKVDALHAIEAVTGIPARKLRASDRFGHEIGSLSIFDDTLDLLGGKLLLQKRRDGRSLLLVHVKTVDDFVWDWPF